MPSQDPTKRELIIIGGGLSGLTTAYYLKHQTNLTPLILEAQSKPGGRIKTSDNIDLGATWFGNEHEYLINLLKQLEVQRFPQYQKGKGIFIHNAVEPPHFFDSDQDDSATYRIAGGTSNLVQALMEQSQAELRLNQTVTKIRTRDDDLEIITNKTKFYAKKVLVALPPRIIAQKIQFSPALPSAIVDLMNKTQTWMSNAIKVGITYDKPFWRDKNCSGTLVAPNGPVIELYDHSSHDQSSFALMGFANETLRKHPADKRKELILKFLSTYFGRQANDYILYREKDWIKDSYITTNLTESIYMRPQYGSPVWNKWYMNDRLLFSGSETSESFGGYMEGAVRAGKRAAAMITQRT